MHIHRLEKIWLTFGMIMLIVFLVIVGVSGFSMGMNPPTGHAHAIDPAQVSSTPPFDKPGLREIGNKEYEAVMTGFIFAYEPSMMEVPSGSTIHFTITSKDVVHGFEIVGTNVNMMVVPGEINHLTYTFDKPGEYLILCNEYCGAGHEVMQARLIVK